MRLDIAANDGDVINAQHDLHAAAIEFTLADRALIAATELAGSTASLSVHDDHHRDGATLEAARIRHSRCKILLHEAAYKLTAQLEAQPMSNGRARGWISHIEYSVIEHYRHDPPEPFGHYVHDQSAGDLQIGDVILLKWLDGRDAYRVVITSIDWLTLHVELA